MECQQLDRPILLPASSARPFDAFWAMTGKRFAGQLMHTWAKSKETFRTAEIPGARVKGRLISGTAAYEEKSGLLYLFWADTGGLHLSLYARGWTNTLLKPGSGSALAAFTHSGEVFLLWHDGKDEANKISRFKPGAEPIVKSWPDEQFVDSPAIFMHDQQINVLWADTKGVVHRSWLGSNGWNHNTIPNVTNFQCAGVAGGSLDGKIYAYITDEKGSDVTSLVLDGSTQPKNVGVKSGQSYSGIVSPTPRGFFAFWQNQTASLWYGYATGPGPGDRSSAWAGLPERPESEPTATVWDTKLYVAWRSKDSFLKLSHPERVNAPAITVNAATVPKVGGPAPAVVSDAAGSGIHMLWTVRSKDGAQLVHLPVQDGAVPPTVVTKARELAGCAAMTNQTGVDVAYAADAKVFVSSLEDGSWKTTRLADTKIKGTTTCLGYGGKRSVFWTRADNGAIYEAQAPEWKEKKIVGVVAAGSPCAVGSGGDRYLFWRDSRGSLYRSSELSAERPRQTSSLAAGGWDSEIVIERPLKSDPVAIDVDGTVCVFWLQDNKIEGVYFKDDWKPIDPPVLTGETPARIAGVSLSNQACLLYWRRHDGSLRQAAYDVKAKSWQEPKTIVESPAASEPGVTALSGGPQLCWLDPEGAAWATSRKPDGGWQTEKLANPVVTQSVEVPEEALAMG